VKANEGVKMVAGLNPSLLNRLGIPLDVRPERLKAETVVAFDLARAGQQQGAVIRDRGGDGRELGLRERGVPVHIADGTV
jgi:hypothetical protein